MGNNMPLLGDNQTMSSPLLPSIQLGLRLQPFSLFTVFKRYILFTISFSLYDLTNGKYMVNKRYKWWSLYLLQTCPVKGNSWGYLHFFGLIFFFFFHNLCLTFNTGRHWFLHAEAMAKWWHQAWETLKEGAPTLWIEAWKAQDYKLDALATLAMHYWSIYTSLMSWTVVLFVPMIYHLQTVLNGL